MSKFLLLDCGNTQLKIGSYTSGDQHAQLLSCIRLARLREELPSILTSLPFVPNAIFGTNVASAHTATLLEDFFKALGSIYWLKSEKYLAGLANAYEPPSQLGADRWMSLLSVWHHRSNQKVPRIIASFGTATTIDTLDPNGLFVGGCILPGWNMMLQSLAKGTANLPFAEIRPMTNFPTNTHSAIISGCLLAQSSTLLQTYHRVHQKFHSTPELHLSGGALPDLKDYISQLFNEDKHRPQIFHHEHPVLNGIAIAAQTYYMK